MLGGELWFDNLNFAILAIELEDWEVQCCWFGMCKVELWPGSWRLVTDISMWEWVSAMWPFVVRLDQCLDNVAFWLPGIDERTDSWSSFSVPTKLRIRSISRLNSSWCWQMVVVLPVWHGLDAIAVRRVVWGHCSLHTQGRSADQLWSWSVNIPCLYPCLSTLVVSWECWQPRRCARVMVVKSSIWQLDVATEPDSLRCLIEFIPMLEWLSVKRQELQNHP